MKIQAWFALLLLAVLLAGSVIAARTASAEGQVMSSGGYHLTTLTWQEAAVSSGGGYTLRSPEVPELVKICCCKAFLPCVKK